jgi:hypothetical protein
VGRSAPDPKGWNEFTAENWFAFGSFWPSTDLSAGLRARPLQQYRMFNSAIMMLAYIDPGSGSLILQMILAAFVGGLAFFRRSIAAFFRRSNDSKGPGSEPTTDPASSQPANKET